MLEKKLNHHHVPRWYLAAWEVEGRVGCLQNGGVHETGTRRLAVRRDFYRIPKLTEPAIKFLEWFGRQHEDPAVRKMNRRWVALFRAPYMLQHRADQIGRPLPPDEFDVLLQNLEENLHEKIEGSAQDPIRRLGDGDLGPLEDEAERDRFLYFLAVQFSRTARRRESFVRSVESSGVPGVDLDAVAQVAMHMMATALSFYISMTWDEARAKLLTSTDGSFVTSDQPVVNLVDSPRADIPPKEMHIFFPVSPRRALLIEVDSARPGVERVNVSAERVEELNHILSSKAGIQVFGHRDALQAILRAE